MIARESGNIFTMAAKTRKSGGRYCVAGLPNGVSCTNNSLTPGISMHVFPKKHKTFQKWISFVKIHRKNTEDIGPSSALCSEHFEKSCYTRISLDDLSIDNQAKRCLQKGAIPTITNPKKAVTESERDKRHTKKVRIWRESFCLQT